MDAVIDGKVQGVEFVLEGKNAFKTVAFLQQHFESIRQAEVDRFRRRLSGFNSEQEEAVGLLTRSLVDEILTTPISILNAASAEEESGVFVEIAHRIFNLGGKRHVARERRG